MQMAHSDPGITFEENGPIDVAQLNGLYRVVGWDDKGRRNPEDTLEMLRVSQYHIAAHTENRQLVGFARVCGDPYNAQVLDVITHPDFRRQGIATQCMLGILGHLRNSHYVSVTLIDGSGSGRFYQQFGFQLVDPETPARVWRSGTETIDIDVQKP
jgi:GNAT superfamily N-acetyltransferase